MMIRFRNNDVSDSIREIFLYSANRTLRIKILKPGYNLPYRTFELPTKLQKYNPFQHLIRYYTFVSILTNIIGSNHQDVSTIDLGLFCILSFFYLFQGGGASEPSPLEPHTVFHRYRNIVMLGVSIACQLHCASLSTVVHWFEHDCVRIHTQ